MYQINHPEDTIVAIITPLGIGGVGVIRLSGTKSIEMVDCIFVAKNKKGLKQLKNFTVRYGWINKNGVTPLLSQTEPELLDEVLVTVMRSPHSYTKEDVVEISCHGGVVVLKAVLELVLSAGARLAEPGEFTKRAFLNGRIDLTQAEAVLDIIKAKTQKSLSLGLCQMQGQLSTELATLREVMMNIYVALEAMVNFPEDDIDPLEREQLLIKLREIKQKVDQLISSSDQGRILKEGIRIVLCGRPNVGKSSILNALLRQKRAIVSAIAGTTRDTLEESAQIQGVPVQLVDTAGILEPRDLIEQEAIVRSRQAIDLADLVLLILDGGLPLNEDDLQMIDSLKNKNVVVVVNKCDLEFQVDDLFLKKCFGSEPIVFVSALKEQGLDELKKVMLTKIGHGVDAEHHGTTLITSVRHLRALRECRQAMNRAVESFEGGVSFEFVSEDIKSAVNFLDAITGREIDTDLLDQIFDQFCIGK